MVRMRFSRSDIDGGRPFDWSRASPTYARYRDIYPREMLDAIGRMGRCSDGHRVLDVGTGTGVIPRMMRDCGAEWTGIDSSSGQISQAMSLSEGMGIRYLVSSVEDADLPDSHFDTVTACQCMQYFDHPRAARNIRRMLALRGLLLFAYMAWLPDEDVIARATEDLVLEYNPRWSGAGETVHPIDVPDVYLGFFEPVDHIEFVADVPFTRDTWNGRVRSCRGIGASDRRVASGRGRRRMGVRPPRTAQAHRPGGVHGEALLRDIGSQIQSPRLTDASRPLSPHPEYHTDFDCE